MCLKDAIVDTNNLSLALCWIVELFVAIQAQNSGKIGIFAFKTSDARRFAKLSKADDTIIRALISYRNKYVHEGKYRTNNASIKYILLSVQQFALNRCSVYADINSKQFDV